MMLSWPVPTQLEGLWEGHGREETAERRSGQPYVSSEFFPMGMSAPEVGLAWSE